MTGTRRRDISVSIAVGGLLVTMVFNTIGVWQQVEQSRRDRVATELGLLTQLSALAIEAKRRVAGIESDLLCETAPPSETEEAALAEAAQYYDYLAWLFNQGHIKMDEAKRYWGSSMINTYEVFLTANVKKGRSRFPELRAFKARERELWPPLPSC